MAFHVTVRRLAAALLIAALGTGAAHACRTRQAGMDDSPEELVASAREVYLARVVAATELEAGQVSYEFTVVERLAGPVRGRFAISSQSTVATDAEARHNHDDERFWRLGGGRLGGESNWCYITLRFDVGMTYLVFLDRLKTYRSAERIVVYPGQATNMQDKWYRFVQEGLRAKGAR
jgi:hypothetical protein